MLGTKTSYHRHKGVSVGWVNSFWLSKLLYFGWVKWNFVTTGRSERRWVGTPGRRCRCSGRRRRFAPPPASAAATAACRAHEPFYTWHHPLRRPPSLTAPVCAKSHFTQPKKAIYSTKTDLLSQLKPLYAYDMTFLCRRSSLFLNFMFHTLWREPNRCQ